MDAGNRNGGLDDAEARLEPLAAGQVHEQSDHDQSHYEDHDSARLPSGRELSATEHRNLSAWFERPRKDSKAG